MIDIKVKDHTLYVHTDYRPDIVKFMRSRPVRKWNTFTREWELPEQELENLLPILNGLEYQIKYEEAQKPQKIPEWYEFKTKPYQHQIEGIEYGLSHNKFLLADSMGLGKSYQVLNIACILKKQKNIKHVLIITCINSIKYNWRNEVSEHTNETGYILGTRLTKKGNEYIGSNEDRLADIKNLSSNPSYFIITNIETLRYNKKIEVPLKTKKNGVQRYKKQTVFPIVEELQKQIKNGEISVIISDEMHKCFSYDTLVYTEEGLIEIGKIVDTKKYKIKTLDEYGNTKFVEPINYFKNPVSKKMLRLKLEKNDGSIVEIVCTHNHKFLTKTRGYVEAIDLISSDEVVEVD